MTKIFVSYRRNDSQHQTGRLWEHLSRRFGPDNVFYDVDTIPVGVNWKEHLQAQVRQCDVMLISIGDAWLDEMNERANDEDDMVRFEIETALQRGIPIIPLLVSKAPMPSSNDLPESVKKVPEWNGMPIRPGRDFNRDVADLMTAIEKLPPRRHSAKTKVVESANEKATELGEAKVGSSNGLPALTPGLKLSGQAAAKATSALDRMASSSPTKTRYAKLAAVGLLIIALIAVIASLGSWLPWSSPGSNNSTDTSTAAGSENDKERERKRHGEAGSENGTHVGDSDASKRTYGPIIGCSISVLRNPYFAAIADALSVEAQQKGFNVVVRDAESDYDTQVKHIEEFIAKQMSAIAVTPLDGSQIVPVLRKANEAGIPIFTVDMPCTSDDVTIAGHVEMDHSLGGQLAAQALIEGLGEAGGNVLILDFKGAPSCVRRVNGFQQALKMHQERVRADIKIVETLDGEGMFK